MSTLKMGTATLATENAGSIDITNEVNFPAGHIIQTHFNEIEASAPVIVNNTTIIGTLNIEFNRIKPNSHFLIRISSLVYRPSTSAACYLGYRISVNGTVIQTRDRMVKDDNSWTTSDALFKDTTTGSVDDTVKIETLYKNSASNDNFFRLPTLLVQEIAV